MASLLDELLFQDESALSQSGANKKVSLWILEDDIIRPATKIEVRNKLEPGIYIVDVHRDYGLYCKKVEASSDELFIFSNSITTDLIAEIDLFWSKADLYKENNLVHKRGILLEGLAGVGKSSIISLLSNRIVSEGGIVFKITNPKNLLYYIPFLKDNLRKIEADTPVITIIEDIDEYEDYYPELLDFLDGKSHVEHHIVIATTNNSEDLDDTLLRPSRFDLRIEVELPNEKIREEYFKFKSVPEEDIQELVFKSEYFSIADLKELYICIYLLGYPIDKAVEKSSQIKEKKNYSLRDSKNSSMTI